MCRVDVIGHWHWLAAGSSGDEAVDTREKCVPHTPQLPYAAETIVSMVGVRSLKSRNLDESDTSLWSFAKCHDPPRYDSVLVTTRRYVIGAWDGLAEEA